MEVWAGGVSFGGSVVGEADKLTPFDRCRSPSFDITSIKVSVGGEEADGFAGGWVFAGTDNGDVVTIAGWGVVAGLKEIGLAIVSGLDGSIHRRTVVDGLAFGDETDAGDINTPAGSMTTSIWSLIDAVAALGFALGTAIGESAGREKGGAALADNAETGNIANARFEVGNGSDNRGDGDDGDIEKETDDGGDDQSDPGRHGRN